MPPTLLQNADGTWTVTAVVDAGDDAAAAEALALEANAITSNPNPEPEPEP